MAPSSVKIEASEPGDLETATSIAIPSTHGSGELEEPLLLRKGSSLPLGSFRSNCEKHTAIIGSNVAPIESLDYELIENEIFRQDWRSRTKIEILQYVVLKWTFALLIALFTALVGLGINVAVENIAGAKFVWTAKDIQENGYVWAFLGYAGINVSLVGFAAVLVVYIAPAAAGSGIPEVKAFLNGVDTPNIFSFKTFFVKIFGAIGSVAGGLIVGKEGPLVHIGSCIAAILGQGGSRKYHLTWRWLRFFKNDRDRRDLVTCGSAAGVAAAFRAPVGGVLFALEEVTSWWRSPLLWRAFFTTAVVAVVLRAGMAWCSRGHCGLFGEGGLIIFDTNSVISDYGLRDLLPAIVVAVLGGLFGSLFNNLNGKVVTFYSAWFNEKRPIAKVLLACTMAMITSICAFVLPVFAGCRRCPDVARDSRFGCPATGREANYKGFHCPSGHYNDLATLFFNTNDDAIRNLFSTGTPKEFSLSSLMIYFVSSYMLALMTYGIAVPSGLFVPAILCGATYGRATGMVMTSTFGAGGLDEGVFALLGAASFLGGSMRMTVSICIILLELTNSLLLLPLIMVVLLVSKTVGDSFNDAIFDLHVRLKGIPFLDAHPEPFMRRLSAADAITSPIVQFNVVEKVGTIVEVLRSTRHNAFAVLDKEGTVFYGLVLRSHIMVLLEKKEFLPSASSPPVETHFTSVDFAKSGSGRRANIELLQITAEQSEMYLDLGLVTNTSPYTVLETTSLAKAFTLFRQLGLRHLCVMSRAQQGLPIVGILTRHDFMPEYLRSIHPHL
ncbi:unnamed protein product [Calypogeia fissa]